MKGRIAVIAILWASLWSTQARCADRTFTGVTRLTADTNWQYGSITFDDQSVIVTNGFRLSLEGTTKITFKGSPRIVSYEPAASTGRPAGIVLIRAPLLTGTALKIENVGEAGTPGSPGPAGAKGRKGGQGTQRDWNPWNGCIGGSNGGVGGPGSDGGDGGPGANGGAGGAIVLDIGNGCWNGGLPRFVMAVSGGIGGRGGALGAAGPGGDGGDGAPGTAWCGGTSPGPSGPPGRPGREGVDSTAGNPGPIIDVRQTCTPKNLKPEAGAIR
jgi:hypothetical protein